MSYSDIICLVFSCLHLKIASGMVKVKKRERIITKKPHPVKGICILIENGKPCNRPVASRGVCDMHRSYLDFKNLLEIYALPPESRKKTYQVNPDVTTGICCIIENGFPCSAEAVKKQSLCLRHYQALWQREKLSGDLRLEQFLTPVTFSRRKKPREGICVVKEETRDGKVRFCAGPAAEMGLCEKHLKILKKNPALLNEIGNSLSRKRCLEKGICVIQERTERGKTITCKRKAFARGFCREHYKFLERKNPGLFEKLANPVRKKPEYRLKKEENREKGICVIVENDTGCNERTPRKRRLCDKHYYALQREGTLEVLTDQFIKAEKIIVLEKKPVEALVEGFCILMVNGIPCTNTPKRRGICGSCLWIIERTEGYEIEQFVRPPVARMKPAVERKPEIMKGVCLLQQDGVPCRDAAVIRGLCRAHYRLVKRLRKLAAIGLTQEEMDRLPDIPHFYFDKNIVIRFAMHEKLGVEPDSCVALVDAVLRKKICATVSADCVRALYSHLGHELSLPSKEGGSAMKTQEAEKLARQYTGELFFGRGGLWRFISFNEDHLALCTYKGHLPKLSLEDALELHLYAQAKHDYKVTLFVTGDRGILEYGEGVSPEKVARNCEDLLDHRYLKVLKKSVKTPDLPPGVSFPRPSFK